MRLAVAGKECSRTRSRHLMNSSPINLKLVAVAVTCTSMVTVGAAGLAALVDLVVADCLLRKVCSDRRDSALGCTCQRRSRQSNLGRSAANCCSSDNTHSDLCNWTRQRQLLVGKSRRGRRVLCPCIGSCSSRDRGRTVCFHRSTHPFFDHTYSNRGRHRPRQSSRNIETGLCTDKLCRRPRRSLRGDDEPPIEPQPTLNCCLFFSSFLKLSFQFYLCNLLFHVFINYFR